MDQQFKEVFESFDEIKSQLDYLIGYVQAATDLKKISCEKYLTNDKKSA